MTPVLGYLVGGCLIVLLMALVAGIAWRKSQTKSTNRSDVRQLKEKVVLPLRSDVDDFCEMEDKNPDVVPCNKGKIHFIFYSSTTFLLPLRPRYYNNNIFQRQIQIIN